MARKNRRKGWRFEHAKEPALPEEEADIAEVIGTLAPLGVSVHIRGTDGLAVVEFRKATGVGRASRVIQDYDLERLLGGL